MIGPWLRAPGVRVAYRSLAQIRKTALAARSVLGVTEPNIDMIDLLENRLRKVGIHFHLVESAEMPGEAARALPEAGLIVLTKEAYNAIHDDDADYHLLVPHEFAHIALRHRATFSRATSRDPIITGEDSEVQADWFSHEFAMPVELMRRYCASVEMVQQAFNVPRREAEIRVSALRQENVISW